MGTLFSVALLVLPTLVLIVVICEKPCQDKIVAMCLLVSGVMLLVLPVYTATKVERINTVIRLNNHNCSFCGITNQEKGDGTCCDRLGWFATCISSVECANTRNNYKEQLKRELKSTVLKLLLPVGVCLMILIVTMGLPEDCQEVYDSIRLAVRRSCRDCSRWFKRRLRRNGNE